MSLLSRDDAARALAVAAVSRCGRMIERSGPAALAAGEISQITEAVTGRRLRYLALESGAYRQRLARVWGAETRPAGAKSPICGVIAFVHPTGLEG
jgi:uncharacterized protein YbjT (DUF2867 family)